MTRPLLATSLLVIGLHGSFARAQVPAERAWTMLQTGVGSDDRDTRTRAVEALGLLVKDDRARRLAESKLTDGEADVRAAAATTLGQRAPHSSPSAASATKSSNRLRMITSRLSVPWPRRSSPTIPIRRAGRPSPPRRPTRSGPCAPRPSVPSPSAATGHCFRRSFPGSTTTKRQCGSTLPPRSCI